MENQYSDLPQRFYDSIEFVRQMKSSLKLRFGVWNQHHQAYHFANLMELTIQVG